MKISYVTSEEIGHSPAAVNMLTGVVYVNADLWNKFTDFEKKFFLAHEEGHFVLQTNSEFEADLYALKKVYKSERKSLKKSLKALAKVDLISDERLERLYLEILKIDSELNNNKKAKQEIMKIKQTGRDSLFMESPRSVNTPVIEIQDTAIPQELVPEPVDQKTVYLKNGIRIGNLFFSFETIALTVICVLLYKILNK
ncbi:MAG TPA: hypothetical protein PLL02_00965 [Bacteroidales bacterium]|nr:hypothetical protein [Bacteroidales bacterium]